MVKSYIENVNGDIGMICKNCGAEIDEKLLLCPYCNSENEKVAQKEQNEYIEDYKNKIKELESVPDRMIKKSSKAMLLVAGISLIVFLMCIIIGYGASKCVGDDSIEKRDKHIDKLEKYYDDGDYEKIGDYLDSKNLYGTFYEKYRRTYDLYDGMDWKIESIEREVEFIEKYDADVSNVATSIGYVMGELEKIRKIEEEGFIYEEEDAILYIKSRYFEILKEKMMITEQEIEAGIDEYIETKNCEKLAEIVIERIKKK